MGVSVSDTSLKIDESFIILGIWYNQILIIETALFDPVSSEAKC